MNVVHESSSLTAEAALEVVRRSAEKAGALGVPCSIVAVDHAGSVIALLRMDGASLASLQVAQDKAYTAACWGLPTEQWHDVMEADPRLGSVPMAVDRMVTFGGGLPITVGGGIVGALGVSGGSYVQDMQTAASGLQALELDEPVAAAP
jgi:uncharacterized protein GlcG (DUF336 family)